MVLKKILESSLDSKGLNEACCTLNRARRLGLMMTKDQTGGGGGQGSEKRSLPFLKVGVVQLLSHV